MISGAEEEHDPERRPGSRPRRRACGRRGRPRDRSAGRTTCRRRPARTRSAARPCCIVLEHRDAPGVRPRCRACPTAHPRPLLVHDVARVADELARQRARAPAGQELRRLELLRDELRLGLGADCATCRSSRTRGRRRSRSAPRTRSRARRTRRRRGRRPAKWLPSGARRRTSSIAPTANGGHEDDNERCDEHRHRPDPATTRRRSRVAA